MKNRLTGFVPLVGTALILSSAAAVQAADAEKSPVSGTVSFDVNTHFISYGADVWATGGQWDNPTFNPLLELAYAVDDKWKLYLGTWWDVNDNVTTSIGDKVVQEVDVWTGASYAFEKVTVKMLYQEWMYASDSERIVDLVVSANDMMFNPSLTIHTRVDGNGMQEEGIVAVLGGSYALPAMGKLTVSFPVNVAFATDDFHGGDAGYAFANVGVTAAVDLGKGFSFSVNATGWHTSGDVIPNNPEETFITGRAGFGFAF